MGARHRIGIGLSYRPARLHRLAKFIPWNRFLGSINVLKYGLCILIHTGREERENTNMTQCTQEIGYFQSINSDKHLPQIPLTGQFFVDDGILTGLL
jgi:hypothetical protein